MDWVHILLQAQGYNPILPSYPQVDLQAVAALNPDLIILDIVMGQQLPLGWHLLDLLKLSAATCAGNLRHLPKNGGLDRMCQN